MIVIGQTLCHYRITAALAAGGMGEVSHGTEDRAERPIVLVRNWRRRMERE